MIKWYVTEDRLIAWSAITLLLQIRLKNISKWGRRSKLIYNTLITHQHFKWHRNQPPFSTVAHTITEQAEYCFTYVTLMRTKTSNGILTCEPNIIGCLTLHKVYANSTRTHNTYHLDQAQSIMEIYFIWIW